MRGAKTTHISGSLWNDPWQGQASRRPLRLQREPQCGNRVQITGDGGELVGAPRVLACTFTMEPQTFDLLVLNRECVDQLSGRVRCITW